MATNPTRSEQVVNDYKQRKLARSAMHRIHELLRKWEAERAFDQRVARYGIVALLLLLAAAYLLMPGSESVTL